MLGDLSLRRTGTNGCEDSVVIRFIIMMNVVTMMIFMMIFMIIAIELMMTKMMITTMITITREEGSTLLELCGDLASPVTVQSYSHQLEVTKMKTKEKMTNMHFLHLTRFACAQLRRGSKFTPREGFFSDMCPR